MEAVTGGLARFRLLFYFLTVHSPAIMKTIPFHPFSILLLPVFLSVICSLPFVDAKEIVVRDTASLRQALATLEPKTTLKIAPGEYPGGHRVANVSELTVEGLDPNDPPQFRGGGNAWHFSRCEKLTVRNMLIIGQSGNGLNLDDGGLADQPVRGVTLEAIEIRDIGPKGNCDGIKCSGIEQMTIRNCTIHGWSGQGIDFVGCHDCTIVACRLIGKPGFPGTAGVQTKGGCEKIRIVSNHFVNAGSRPMNIGGSTGLDYFRPKGVKYEAKDIEATDNIIQGGDCGAAFVGVDGAKFTGNTILYPERWIFRILQETKAPGFAPCRNVTIEGNTVFIQRQKVTVDVNIGAGTEPGSFQYLNNRWFADETSTPYKPRLSE